MVKKKATAAISVSDGKGGMIPVLDHRFLPGQWPIQFVVPHKQEQADRWLRYLAAGCDQRGWGISNLAQLERRENSGSISIHEGGKSLLAIAWERKKAGALNIRARLTEPVPQLSLDEAQKFLDEATIRCRAGATESIYARGTLQYDGMAWRGELWLDNQLRLGPPSRHDETAILSPVRIVHVDAQLECIGVSDRSYVLNETLVEVSLFLSVVMGTAVRRPDSGRAWTWNSTATDCEIRNLGYLERNNPPTMPSRGTNRSTLLHSVAFPPVNDGSSTEHSLRDDVIDLWKAYRSLPPAHRDQFLRVAAKWQEAVLHWQERESLSYALMIIACEALGPPEINDYNCYQVIEGLLGQQTADRLRQHKPHAQATRSIHLHTGEFFGRDLLRDMNFMPTYQDPSFREAHRELFQITKAAIIEWLKRGGQFAIPTRKPKKTLRRRVREHALVLIPIAFVLGLIGSWVFNQFIH